jgi:hypothetical protein
MKKRTFSVPLKTILTRLTELAVGLEILDTGDLETRLLQLVGEMDVVVKEKLGPAWEQLGKLRLEAATIAEELERRTSVSSR